MILILRPYSGADSYCISECNTYEEAIKFIKDNCYYDLKDYRIYEAKELELTLQTKNGNNE